MPGVFLALEIQSAQLSTPGAIQRIADGLLPAGMAHDRRASIDGEMATKGLSDCRGSHVRQDKRFANDKLG